MQSQEYRRFQISKEEVVPTALRMRHEGISLAMIHGFIQTDGQVQISYEYAVDPWVESYYVVGETVIPSISDIYSYAATWPEIEIHELLGIEFEGLDTSARLFLPENMLVTQGKGQILVSSLSDLLEKRDEMITEGGEGE